MWRRMTRALTLPLLALLLACARIEPPPGGPPDADPPRLVATTPESLASLADFGGEAEFRFDEVVSEGGSASTGSGTGDLERLVILSPTTRVPDVAWRRTRITVKPDEGWRPGRVYRVELLPGVTDLRRNRSEEGAVITFTTGGPTPASRLEGSVFDWSSSRPAANALVVAELLPDSLPYRGLADSSGRFSLGPLPAGDYLVSGVLDQNRNRRADGREAFDTARVRAGAAGAVRVGELWTFVHDTTPPRITGVTVGDSLSAIIQLSQPLAPGLRLRPQDAGLALLPDSTPLPVVSILPKPIDDSLNVKPVPAPPADSAAPRAPARRQAAPAAPAALASRPPLSDRLVLRVRRPWIPGARYAVTVRGIRTVTGVVGEARGTLAVPERGAPADSAAAQPDSIAPAEE
jgi:hypothetical protein